MESLQQIHVAFSPENNTVIWMWEYQGRYNNNKICWGRQSLNLPMIPMFLQILLIIWLTWLFHFISSSRKIPKNFTDLTCQSLCRSLSFSVELVTKLHTVSFWDIQNQFICWKPIISFLWFTIQKYSWIVYLD